MYEGGVICEASSYLLANYKVMVRSTFLPSSAMSSFQFVRLSYKISIKFKVFERITVRKMCERIMCVCVFFFFLGGGVFNDLVYNKNLVITKFKPRANDLCISEVHCIGTRWCSFVSFRLLGGLILLSYCRVAFGLSVAKGTDSDSVLSGHLLLF